MLDKLRSNSSPAIHLLGWNILGMNWQGESHIFLMMSCSTIFHYNNLKDFMANLKTCSFYVCLHNTTHSTSPTNFLVMLLISAWVTVYLYYCFQRKQYSYHLSLWDTSLHPNIISESIGQFQSNLTGGARSQRYYILEKLVLGREKHTN